MCPHLLQTDMNRNALNQIGEHKSTCRGSTVALCCALANVCWLLVFFPNADTGAPPKKGSTAIIVKETFRQKRSCLLKAINYQSENKEVGMHWDTGKRVSKAELLRKRWS